MSRMFALFALSAITALSACADLDAPEKCDDLVDSICANTEDECTPAVAYDTCIETLADAGMDCDTVVAVEDSYESCLEQVRESEECMVLDGLPDDCEGVLLSDG